MSAISFLAGMGAGYITGKEKAEEQKRRDARDKREQDAFDMRKTEFDQTQADKAALKEAGAPVTVTPEQGPPTEAAVVDARLNDRQPDAIGYRVGNGPNAKMFASQGLADTAAKPMQTQEARRTRMADLAAQGNTFAATALNHDQQTAKFNQEQMAIAKKLKDEGVFDTVAALRRGDTAGMVDAFNRAGDHKIIGDVTITPEMRDVPGVGQIQTNTATFQLQGPDGKVQTVTRNSHDLSMQVMPYEKQLEELRKGKKEVSEADGRAATAEYHRAAADALKPGGAKDKRNSTDMSEIDTRVLADINKQREMIQSEIIKAQAAENFDPTKPGAKALTTQLAALSLKASQIQAKYSNAIAPDPLNVRGTAPTVASNGHEVVAPQQQQARDSDRNLILSGELKKAQERLAAGDPRAQGDIDAISKELGRSASVAPVQPAPATPQAIAATGIAPAVPSVAPAAVVAPKAVQAIAAQGVQAPAPSYAAWMAAKDAKDELINAANKMTPERRDLYLRSRLPQIEQAIQFNQNYKTY